MKSRGVVTGIGVVAPNGTGHETYWPALLNGKSGLQPVTGADGAPVGLAGVIDGFAAADHMPGRLVVQTDRWTQFALAAAGLALADAGVDLDSVPDYEIGVATGSSSGGNEFGQREIQKLWTSGPERVGAYQSIAWFYAASTGQISIRYGARGPCSVLVSEQAAGLDALGQARRTLRCGARIVIAGGTEAPLSPYALACQRVTGRISEGDAPEHGYLPFDRQAAGHVPGEGGAMLIVEDAAAARDRGAAPYAAIAGYAATFDPAPDDGGAGSLRAIDMALADAGIRPAEVGVVFADGAAVPGLDRAEAAAIAAVFGPHGVPVTAPKSLVGRLYAGGGALDVATALLAMRDGVIPPTAGVADVPDAYRIDLVTGAPRPARVRSALVLARGAGGYNTAVVLATEAE